MKSKATGIQYADSSDGQVYDLKIEVVKDEFGKIVSGLVIGQTLEQNMSCMLIAKPGDFKTNLNLGVDLPSTLLGEGLLAKRHQIKEQFSKDGLNVKHLDFYSIDKLAIDAEYE